MCFAPLTFGKKKNTPINFLSILDTLLTFEKILRYPLNSIYYLDLN